MLSNVRAADLPASCGIAVDEELLSMITSDEATAVTPLMSHIFLSLLGLIPDAAENNLPLAQQWLFGFGREEEPCSNPWRQLQQIVGGIDEQELQRALDWMREHHIIDLREEGASLYLTLRNVIAIRRDGDCADADLTN